MSRTDPHHVLHAANPVSDAVHDEQRLAAIRAAVDTRRAAVDTRPVATSIVRRPLFHRRVAVLAGLSIAAAAATTAVVVDRSASDTQNVAMGQSEMSPLLQSAARWCLNPGKSDPQFPIKPPSVTMADLAVAAQRDNKAVTLFIGSSEYRACDVDMTPGKEMSGGLRDLPWTSTSKDWLPGSAQVLGLSSTESDGGDVMVTGRVSDQVHRLLLDHGDGHTTAARLTRGTYGLVSDGHTVKRNAELVSYDANGTEIGRDRLFSHLDQTDDEQCYVDPAGKVVYGKPGKDCLPAQAWRR